MDPDVVEADRGGPSPRPRHRLRYAAICGVAVLGLVGVLLATAGPGGSTVAPFTLSRLGGGSPISYPVPGAGGNPVVINFFASWCTPCQTELPAFAAVAAQEEAAGSPVRFLGIDGNDDPASGLAMARASGVGYPVAQDYYESVANHLGISGLPDTVFIDRTGRLAHIIRGPVDAATFTHWIAVISSGGPPS